MADSDSLTDSARSVSRGRDFQSSGRGGIGNIRRTSQEPGSPGYPLSPKSSIGDGHEPVTIVRGREPVPSGSPDRARSTGRGGVGNIRSSSIARAVSRAPRDQNHPQTTTLVNERAQAEAEYERSVLKASEEAARAKKHSSGRGGAGNIARSKSKSKTRSQSRDGLHLRSRSRSKGLPVPLHSSGRGGAGNIQQGSPDDAEYIDELDNEESDRARLSHVEGIHSTGRGGSANITALQHGPPTPPEHSHLHSTSFSLLPNDDAESATAVHQHAESTGRGGSGNIFQSRSRSRSASKEREQAAHGLNKLWQRVSRSRGRAPRKSETSSGSLSPTTNGVDADLRAMRLSEDSREHEAEHAANGGAPADGPAPGTEE
ncbi:uncharacterized protein LAESUDRAFT_667286 [Laetiporus sulphureus 93-53]|uniref:Uncharacterized protein n=1 Tax=Laetiporus sulphureus 93-53 TaxID=1314785 RepID=A0A165AZQ1_9APHY|nr:uncharacterized protein LAESUDRAFT_667286 [Laetiporus sulphureus 93-53]KZS99956.1 hypothetical protein LAESUDRAFT_667286 [Laetiporus sulphureus 93-53]